MWDFLYSWTGMGIMALLLVVLIVVLFILRNQREDED